MDNFSASLSFLYVSVYQMKLIYREQGEMGTHGGSEGIPRKTLLCKQ